MRCSTAFLALWARTGFPALAWAGLIFFLSAQPASVFPEIGPMDALAQVSHFSLYAVLMLLLVRALRVGAGLAPRPAWAIGLALLALYALSDEFHQSFVPGRNPDVLDWLTDMAGGLAAWWLLRRRERHRTGEAG